MPVILFTRRISAIPDAQDAAAESEFRGVALPRKIKGALSLERRGGEGTAKGKRPAKVSDRTFGGTGLIEAFASRRGQPRMY